MFISAKNSEGTWCVLVCTVHLHLCKHVCMVFAHVYVWVLCMFLYWSPPCCCSQGLSVNQELTSGLDCLANELPGSACFCLPTACVMEACLHACLLQGCWDPNSGSRVCTGSIWLTGPCLCPWCWIFFFNSSLGDGCKGILESNNPFYTDCLF